MLKSKNKHTIKTIDGDQDLYIYAELINPKINLANSTITFTANYFATYQKLLREATAAETTPDGHEMFPAMPAQYEDKTITLHTNTETYTKDMVEGLYAKIKPLLPTGSGYFDTVKNPIGVAFSFTVKNGNFFGLAANDWEEV